MAHLRIGQDLNKRRRKTKKYYNRYPSGRKDSDNHLSTGNKFYNTMKGDSKLLQINLQKDDKSEVSTLLRTTELAQISESENASDVGSTKGINLVSGLEAKSLNLRGLNLYQGRDKYLLSVVGNILYRLNHDPFWMNNIQKSEKNER
mmetsp:Transcript_7100/g.6299  ORF Transcript_7100/g.6299 Transcript_7100/m.6299 type:complete len:147 (+) Transcript_7100:556-996(+)